MKRPALFVLLAVLPLTAACDRTAPAAVNSAPPMAVTLGNASITNIPETFESGGVVRARLTATVASRVMATVTAVHVRAGDRVRRGAPLVTLDARELTANAAGARAASTASAESGRAADSETRAAESSLRLARATHDRVKTLYDRKSATAQEFDEAVSGLTRAEAQLASAQARASGAIAAREAAEAASRGSEIALSYAVLTAPFDGTIAERFVDPGSMAAPGVPLLVIEDPSSLRLDVQMDEIRAQRISLGQEVEVRADGTGEDAWRPARVMEIGRVDPASHNFLVKVGIANPVSLRSGLFGRVRAPASLHRVLTVPDSSLIRRGQLTFVFAVGVESVARLRPVVTGASAHGRTEILAGVNDGDAIVLNPPASLTDGAQVTGSRR